jgi:hypothetical protein
MIAIVEHQARACTGAAPTFEELLPAIEQHAAVAFRSLPPSEREDLVHWFCNAIGLRDSSEAKVIGPANHHAV